MSSERGWTINEYDGCDGWNRVAAIDKSYESRFTLSVVRSENGFTLESTEKAASKTYTVNVEDIEGCAFVRVAETCTTPPVSIGVVAASISQWNRRGVIEHLYVSTAWRNAGVGTALLEKAVEFLSLHGLRSAFVETQNTNPAAVGFYEAHGFRLCGFDMDLYDPEAVMPGEIAIFLSKSL